MSGTQQVDSQSLRDTGAAFASASADVETLISTVTSSVGSLVWTGGIAEQFREDFDGRYRPMLEQLAADMKATSTAMHDKADQYDLVFHGSA